MKSGSTATSPRPSGSSDSKGDRVSVLEIAELGKPMQIHQTDETQRLPELARAHPRRSPMGDAVHKEGAEGEKPASAPTLRQARRSRSPKIHTVAINRVQFPTRTSSGLTRAKSDSRPPRPTPPPTFAPATSCKL